MSDVTPSGLNPSLLLLADGRFPSGGHATSAGVEAAIGIGDIVDAASLQRYLHGRVDTTGRVDAAFAAHTAAIDPSDPDLADRIAAVDDEYESRTISPYLCTVSRRLGRQALRAGGHVWSHPLPDACVDVHQPIAFGALVAAASGTPRDAALLTLHHLTASVTTAAVRLLGLDPFQMSSLQASLAPAHADLAGHAGEWATCAPTDLPASGGALTDILGEAHGARTARLFAA